MYSLDVNFLKDRSLDAKKTAMTTITAIGKPDFEKQLPIYIGAGVMLLLPLMAGGSILFVNWQKGQSQENIQVLEAELARLKAQNQKVTELENKVKTVDTETAALVGVFSQVKPWSALLQDLTDQTPPGIQLVSLQQTGKVLTLSGFAGTYGALNDFLLMLQNSPFFKADKTKLVSATTAPLPISGEGVISEPDDPDPTTKESGVVQIPQGVKYSITTELTDTPDKELLPELIRKGAIGLVTRFKTLEQKGILQPATTSPPVPPTPGATPAPGTPAPGTPAPGTPASPAPANP